MLLVVVGTFDVVLIVDNCETNSKSHFRGVLLKELSKFGKSGRVTCLMFCQCGRCVEMCTVS